MGAALKPGRNMADSYNLEIDHPLRTAADHDVSWMRIHGGRRKHLLPSTP
jgi:hypothetical protein